MSAFLDTFQKVVSSLPQYSSSARWVMSRKHYAMLIHAKYKTIKAVRKAKARKKRVNARCGRR